MLKEPIFKLRPERYPEVGCSSVEGKHIPHKYTKTQGQEGISGSEKSGQSVGARNEVPDTWSSIDICRSFNDFILTAMESLPWVLRREVASPYFQFQELHSRYRSNS